MYTCPETDIYSRLTHGLTEVTNTRPGLCKDAAEEWERTRRQSPQPQGSVGTLQGGEVEHKPVKDPDMGLIS